MEKHTITVTARVHAGDNPQVTLLLNGEPIGYYGPFGSWIVAETAARAIIKNAAQHLEREKQRLLDAIKSQ